VRSAHASRVGKGVPPREFLSDSDDCALAERWGVSLDTMRRVVLSAQDYEQETGGRRVQIISGFRTQQQQRDLGRSGRPTAPDDRSTHRSCPATGVDISLGLLPTEFMKATWGRIALVNGLRWGGGGRVDTDTGIPLDWPHVDRGPRR